MKKLSIIIAILLFPFAMNAQTKERKLKVIDTDTILEKTKQLGYFQKAYVDPGDPRFMLSNADNTFQFGVGGIIHATTFYDFNGATAHKDFVTWHIPVPTANTSHFGLDMGGTRLITKGVSKIKGKEIIAVLELNVGTGTNAVNIRNAYVSFAGLTIGRTYSFFSDLDAGPLTVDNQGPNTQISNRHALIGYKSAVGKHFILGAAAETPSLKMSNYDSINCDFQKVPDITAFVQFHWNYGHVQLSQLVRWLYYVNVDPCVPVTGYNDLTKNMVFGYGTALSGKFFMTKKKNFFLTYQLVAGRGISSYIQELAEAQLDLVTCKGSNNMKPLTTYGGYVALQYEFKYDITAAITAGTVAIHRYNDENYFDKNIDNYKSSYYLAVSAFKRVFKHGLIGVEYLWGERKNIYEDGSIGKGNSNRIDLMMKYTF